MRYSTLDEAYPNSENPFDFRPPQKISFKQLGQLAMHMVKGLKVETEQGVETAQSLLERVYKTVKKAELDPEADGEDKEIKTLPECIRDDTSILIRTIRANLKELKNVREVDLSDPDFEPPTHSW